MIFNLKRQCAEVLGQIILAGIPEFQPDLTVQRVFTRASDNDKYEIYPSLFILPGRGQFTPFPDGDEKWSNDTYLLQEVGCFEGPCELRAVHTTPVARESLENAIIEQFFNQEPPNFAPDYDADDMSTGIIIGRVENVVVRGVQTSAAATASLVLDTEEWRDEMAFGRRRYSFLECTMVWPVYKLTKLPTIDQLIHEVEPVSDLDSTPPFADAEDVQINDDGSIQPA